MAKKQEDNRDIWDKVIDSAPAALGALAGGVAGRYGSRKVFKASRPPQWRGDKYTPMSTAETDKWIEKYNKIKRDGGKKAADDWLRRMKGNVVDVRTAVQGRRMGTTFGAVAGGAIADSVAENNRQKRRK